MSTIKNFLLPYLGLIKTFFLVVVPLVIYKMLQGLRSAYIVKKSEDNFNEAHNDFKTQAQELEDEINNRPIKDNKKEE